MHSTEALQFSILPATFENDTDRLLNIYSSSSDINTKCVDPHVTAFWAESIVRFCLKWDRSELSSHRLNLFAFTENQLANAFTIRGIYPSSLHNALMALRDHQLRGCRERVCEPESLTVQSDGYYDQLFFSINQVWNSAVSMVWGNGDRDVECDDNRPLLCCQLLAEAGDLLDAYLQRDQLARTEESSHHEQVESVVYTSSSSPLGDSSQAHANHILTFAKLVQDAASWYIQRSRSIDTDTDTAHSPTKSQLLAQQLATASRESTDSLLRYLLSSQRAVANADGSVVKIVFRQQQQHGDSAESGRVSEVEEMELQLSDSIIRLEAKVAGLSQQRDSCLARAKQHKVAGRDKMALLALAHRRSADAAHVRLLQSLAGLVDSRMKLGEARTNRIVAEAYSAAAVALRGMRQAGSGAEISVESVADAIQMFNEEVEEMNDVSNALSQHEVVDGDELQQLENELEQLMLRDVISADVTSTDVTRTDVISTDMTRTDVASGVEALAWSLPAVPSSAVTPAPNHQQEQEQEQQQQQQRQQILSDGAASSV